MPADSEPERSAPSARSQRRPPRWRRWWPLGVGLLVIVALVSITFAVENQMQNDQIRMQATLRALWVGDLAATYQAGTQTQAAARTPTLAPPIQATPTPTPTTSPTPASTITPTP